VEAKPLRKLIVAKMGGKNIIKVMRPRNRIHYLLIFKWRMPVKRGKKRGETKMGLKVYSLRKSAKV
jgi:hypothetical protein